MRSIAYCLGRVLIIATLIILVQTHDLTPANARLSQTVSSNPLNSKPETIRLPYQTDRPFDGGKFEVTFDIFVLPFFSELTAIPDDCLTNIAIDDIGADLSGYSSQQLCNLTTGITLDMHKIAGWGRHKVVLSLSNNRGLWGATIRQPRASMVSWFAIPFLTLFLWQLLQFIGAKANPIFDQRRWLAPTVILLVGFFTIFHKYWEPRGMFWDENYRIASAEKYLQGIYFMEIHPPLGKLLIAGGEAILGLNPRIPELTTSDHIQSLPTGFSFAGYRLFPVLLAWLGALPFYFLCLRLIGIRWIAVCMSGLYLFDNALIVHLRGAMLEGPLVFFSLIYLASFARIMRTSSSIELPALLINGVSLAFAIATKAQGAIWLIPSLFVIHKIWQIYGPSARALVRIAVPGGVAITALLAVWQVHFAIAKTPKPALSSQGFYGASAEYRDILSSGRGGNYSSYPIALSNALTYSSETNKGIPSLDMCKPTENGSPFFYWPLGGKAINYRWESGAPHEFKYLYLVANPATWALGLLGILGAFCFYGSLLTSPRLSCKKITSGHQLQIALLITYGIYMIAIAYMESIRGLYLYHYFIPLILSFAIFTGELARIDFLVGFRVNPSRRTAIASFALAVSLVGFGLYSPLTYYRTVTTEQLNSLAITPIWELTCPTCMQKRAFYQPAQRTKTGM